MDHNHRLDTSYILSPTSATYDSPITISPTSSAHGALSPQFHLPQHARRRPHQSTLPVRLLSLDGGGVRGYSTLLLIQELMLKTFVALEGRAPLLNEIPKPCDHFDLIGGTGTGGLIAILLGRLRMDLETCKAVYAKVAKKVFESDKTIGGLPYRKTIFKASKLEDAIRDVVREYGARPGADENETISNYFATTHGRDSGNGGSSKGGHSRMGDSIVGKSTFDSYNSGSTTGSGSSHYGDAPARKKPSSSAGKHKLPPGGDPGDALLFDTRIDRCKTFLTAVYKSSNTTHPPAILRTYESSHSTNPSPRCTIWEAGRATCAHYPAFKPIQIGQDIFLDEGPGRYSPVAQVLEEALVHEWPGREVGVLVSIGSGKKPDHDPTSPSLPPPKSAAKRMVHHTPLGKFADAREKHEEKMADTENIHLEMLQGLHRTGVSPDSYFRVNVEIGVGDYGINEWSRMAEISTNTRKYLSRADVQIINENAAEKMAEIHRAQYGLPSAHYKQTVLNRELPTPREEVVSPVSVSFFRTDDGVSEMGSDHHDQRGGGGHNGHGHGHGQDGGVDEYYEVSDEEINAHLEELQDITRRMHS